MNYIELNGVNSQTIAGLLIQELPQPSKPAMRTNIEQIDGRDGDIITPLGYSAYDKELSIGLYGNYDIDQVIKYFTSSGKVIFSNEEDKYYNYDIIEAIDFERLIRFKRAIVKFHVQPFKYSVEDNSKSFDIDSSINQIKINNAGNIYSKPKLTITGTGNIGIYLNGNQIFAIALADIGQIVIDTNKMEAYLGSTLLNRIVIGDYNNFKLNAGTNIITWSGSVSKIQIDNFSRWI